MTHCDLYSYYEIESSKWNYEYLRPPLTFLEILSDIRFHWFIYRNNFDSILKRTCFLILRILQRISYNIGWILSSQKLQKKLGGKKDVR